MSFTPQQKFERYQRSTPRIYKVGENPVITALLQGFSESDAEVSQQIENTKAQLFVRTAEGNYLNKLATSLGVNRPVELGLDDATFQELIPNLSLKAKQVRKAFYDTSDVFWGPLFSRASLESANAAPFNISPGDLLVIKTESSEIQTIKVLTADVATPGAATAEEVQIMLSRLTNATVSIIEDQLTGDERINIRTDTPGPRGSIEIYDTSTMVGNTKIDFPISKVDLRDRDQRVMIYEIKPNEVIIEIPAIVPALRRTLKGSHHFHEDSTLESPVAPALGTWVGSFFYDVSGSSGQSFTVTRQKCKLDQTITKNNIYTSIVVDDNSSFENTTGRLVFGFGTSRQEQPVRYRGIPNSKTILVDPAYIFQFDHPADEYINVISDTTAYTPRRDGSDYAIYMTSPSGAREAVQEILRSLAAAGILVNFVILAPRYKFVIDNPYISTDDPEIND